LISGVPASGPPAGALQTKEQDDRHRAGGASWRDLARLALDAAACWTRGSARLIAAACALEQFVAAQFGARLVKGKDRCTLMINPDDAPRARDLGDGSLPKVDSRTGSVRLRVEVTDDMMPGQSPYRMAGGMGLSGIAMQTAQAHAGVSLNDLTDETAIDPLSGNAALSGVPVEVSAA
jgi:hypothetical protein